MPNVIGEDEAILEIKLIEWRLPVHEAQLLTYPRLSHCKVGLLMNFNRTVLKSGLPRSVL